MQNDITIHILLRKVFSYLIFLAGGVILYYSYFMPIWHYVDPVPDVKHMLTTSPSFFEYISNIESDKIIQKLSFFAVIFYPFILGSVLIISYSAMMYNELFRFFYKNIKEKSFDKHYFLSLLFLSIPIFISLFAIYYMILLFNIDQTYNFFEKFFSSTTILLALFMFFLGSAFTALMLQLKNHEKLLRVIKRIFSFFINASLHIFLCWSLFLIIVVIIAYLMGHSKAPIYNNIPLIAFALLILSYYFYKKKEYKGLKNLKISFCIIFNSIYVVMYGILFLLMLDRDAEFFNRYTISFGDGFYGLILGFIFFLIASIIMFFILKHELRHVLKNK